MLPRTPHEVRQNPSVLPLDTAGGHEYIKDMTRLEALVKLKTIDFSNEVIVKCLSLLDQHEVTGIMMYDGKTYWTITRYSTTGDDWEIFQENY